MIVRIVKMTFREEKVEEFLGNFNQNKAQIRAFSGCSKLQLLQQAGNPKVFFTYSWWDNEESLEKYRQSNLFKGVWEKTKILFDAKPEAWSLINQIEL